MQDFLSKLDENLLKSLNAFNDIKKVSDDTYLHNLIQSNKKKLYTYLELLKELELRHFSNIDNIDNINQNDFDQNDLKKQFKKNINADIITHKLKNKILNKSCKVENKPEVKCITSIDSVDISPNTIDIPIVKNIKDIPPMFHWYEGDTIYKRGIYVCMVPGFYTRVPFPNTISSTSQNFKINSIPCKYTSKLACTEIKKRMSDLYRSEIRECSYLHSGEKFIKMGTSYRCNIESFGNHDTLDSDMNFITINDIKRILMYSLSDSLLCCIWYQNKFKNGDLILSNIEVFNKS